jgi:hypothetical protein
MEAAELALVARARGEDVRALELFRRAFAAEREAALLVEPDRSAEPTRSVLLRSAAALGIDCGELRESERLAALALSGNPPSEIADEIRTLLDQVNFHRHLEIRGVSLTPHEFQMSLSGDAVGHGIVQQDELLRRMGWTRTLLFRTAERKQGRPFRERGPLPQRLRREFDFFVSIPRAASMAISFRLGSLQQTEIPGVGFGEAVIDEFLTCIEVLQEQPQQLKQRIDDEAYYRNFTELAKQLAPDGVQIRQVGFTAIRAGRERRVSLTTPPEQLRLPEEVLQSDAEIIELRGQLKGAEDIKEHRIRLEHEGKPSVWVRVPPGMMADIVKPLWEEQVLVVALQGRQGIFLKTIRRLEEE